jgi:aspartate carbamoyltransferase catalytic subunit
MTDAAEQMAGSGLHMLDGKIMAAFFFEPGTRTG